MLLSVHFDTEHRFAAEEVDSKLPDGVLSSKLESCSGGAKKLPHDVFGYGRTFAGRPGEVARRGMPVAWHGLNCTGLIGLAGSPVGRKVLAPHPLAPSPPEGRGGMSLILPGLLFESDRGAGSEMQRGEGEFGSSD